MVMLPGCHSARRPSCRVPSRRAWLARIISSSTWATIGQNRLPAAVAGLSLRDSSTQLSLRASLPRTSTADDALELVRQRGLRGLSVEMHISSERHEGGLRVIEKAALTGFGLVDSPAYPQSEVEARQAALNTNLKSLIPYGKKLQCQCQKGDCGEVRFDAGSFDVTLASDREVLAVVGSYQGPLASQVGRYVAPAPA